MMRLTCLWRTLSMSVMGPDLALGMFCWSQAVGIDRLANVDGLLCYFDVGRTAASCLSEILRTLAGAAPVFVAC